MDFFFLGEFSTEKESFDPLCPPEWWVQYFSPFGKSFMRFKIVYEEGSPLPPSFLFLRGGPVQRLKINVWKFNPPYCEKDVKNFWLELNCNFVLPLQNEKFLRCIRGCQRF